MKPGRLSPVAIVQYTDRYINMMKRSIADMDRKTATWLRFLRIFFVFFGSLYSFGSFGLQMPV